MRQLKYKRLSDRGERPLRVIGTLREFLWEVPHLFYFGYVPSLRVVNAFLALGCVEEGRVGGVEWKPFVLTEAEYEEVVSELRATSPTYRRRPLIFAEVPASVASPVEWTTWALSTATGAPFEELLRLTLEERRLIAESRAAAAAHGGEAAEAAHMRWYAAAQALQQFLEPYEQASRARPGV